jgi:hypothetical protein
MEVLGRLDNNQIGEFDKTASSISIALDKLEAAGTALAGPLVQLTQAIELLTAATPDRAPFLAEQENQITFWYHDLLWLVTWIRVAGLYNHRWTREIEQRAAAIRQHVDAAQQPGGTAHDATNSHLLPTVRLQNQGAAGLPSNLFVEGDKHFPGGS